MLCRSRIESEISASMNKKGLHWDVVYDIRSIEERLRAQHKLGMRSKEKKGVRVTLCDTFFGRSPRFFGRDPPVSTPDPQTPEAILSVLTFQTPLQRTILRQWPRVDDHSSYYKPSSDYDRYIPRLLPLFLRQKSHPSAKCTPFQPLSTQRRKSSPSQLLNSPRIRTTIPYRQHNFLTTEVSWK